MWTAGLHTGPSKKVPWGRLVLPKMLGEEEGGFILWLIKNHIHTGIQNNYEIQCGYLEESPNILG